MCDQTLGRCWPLSELRRGRWQATPEAPGIYRWYFSGDHLETVRRRLNLPPDLDLEQCEHGFSCLYVGITRKNLNQRIRWHSEQHLTASSLRSGFISTFRLSLLSLFDIPYTEEGEECINDLMDQLRLCFQQVEPERAEELELQALTTGDVYYPINIRGNQRQEILPSVREMKRIRREYKARWLNHLEV